MEEWKFSWILLQVLTQDLDEAEEQVSTLRSGHACVIGNLQIMQRCHISRMKETFDASLKASPCCWARRSIFTVCFYTPDLLSSSTWGGAAVYPRLFLTADRP